jgi:peroxiredoxin
MNIAQKNFTAILCCLAFANANAQVEILQKAADKVNQSKNFSYADLNTNKDIFSDDLAHTTINAIFINPAPGTNNVPYYDVNTTVVTTTYSGSSRDIFTGKDLILLDFNTHTYRIKDGEQSGYSYLGSLPYLLNTALSDLKTGRFKAILSGDSTVNKTLCYHIKIIPADTVKMDSRKDFLISKANNTLVYFRNKGSGEATKGGMSLGTVHLFTEDYFSAYKFNAAVADISTMGVPAGFKTEEKPKPLLNPGDTAPDFNLVTIDSESTSLAQLKGKVVLIDFSGEGCGACMLAIPALNNLQQKYKGSDVAIISVSIDGTNKSVSSLIKRYHLSYPVYINGKPTADAYHVQAIPNFYIINKQGLVSIVHEGFFEGFEQQVTLEIEKLR